VARVLIAVHDPARRLALRSAVGDQAEAVFCEPAATAEVLGRGVFDLLLVEDPTLLQRVPVPAIVVSANASVREAVEAMRLGALDYLDLETPAPGLAEAIRLGLGERAEDGSGALTGGAPAMRRVYELIEKTCGVDTAVLLVGEEGTGKELVAREIHRRSGRSGPFVAVNCAAVTEAALERDLFGDGREPEAQGRLAAASGGTVFLDEIAEVSLATQVRFLEFIRDGRVQHEGGEATRVDVRVIAATHRDLKRMVEDGEFREDFYYQLSVLSIETPPLRERREDIPALTDAVLRRLERSLGLRGVPTRAALALFQTYGWPGNVRELETVLERALLLADAGTGHVRRLTPATLPPALLSAGDEGTGLEGGLTEQIERIEREILRAALSEADWNQTQAAKALKLKRSSLAVCPGGGAARSSALRGR
jgi:DNA-binding NtrC family response regulator